jgi:ATPase subunit of ABC transporter with duplicated ATPase domains
MLHINDLSYRIEGKPIFDGATAGIPTGHKVGLVGRNGAGKTTLLKIIAGDLSPDMGSITVARNTRIGHVAQEAPGGGEALIDWVLAADRERAELMHEAEIATDAHRIAAIHERLNDIDAHAAPARAAQILSGLGFDEAAQQRPCGSLSGGWRMRVALAAVLFLEPEILLLDEPTNYLDLEGAMWLESYLRSYPHTVVIVSHDRDLLNRAVTAILHLDRGKLTFYSGGYDDFEEARREKQRLELKLMKKQDEERRRIQVFIDRFRAKATKAAQAQSRIKALAKMQPIAAQVDEGVKPFFLPNPAKVLASPLMRFEEVSVGYTADSPVLSGINLRIDQDDRIALLGQNGNGKSTFAKLIAGKLGALAGSVFGANRVDIGYFAQHQLDEPTNHLDVDSREALVHAVAEYEGAVILISHDRHLIEACADRLWVVRDGTVKSYDGDMDSYRSDLLAERGVANKARGAANRTETPRAGRADARRAAADRRASLAPLKKAMQAAEKKVEKLTADIARLDARLADAEFYARDPQSAQRAAIERGQLAKQLAEAEDEWLSASEAYEIADADTDTADA